MEFDFEQLAESQSEITLEEVNKMFHQEIEEFGQSLDVHMEEIKTLINSLISGMEEYQYQQKLLSYTNLTGINYSIEKLELQKDLLYKDFFKLQNLINKFIYQKLIMTYVHIDPITGKREVRLFDNSIDNLMTTEVNMYGKNYVKLSYDIGNRYVQLKNSLPDNKNEGLQETAKQVTLRYEKFRHRIMWELNGEWFGYKLTNRGPINEAFVDFYIKNVELKHSLNHNIDIFMRSENPQGVINADNANGFLIGDVTLNGLQFAVKGAYGSPQNFTQIIAWLKKIKDSDFSHDSLIEFIQRFKEKEQEKATKLVKPMTKRSISAMLKYHLESGALTAPLEKTNGKIHVDFKI